MELATLGHDLVINYVGNEDGREVYRRGVHRRR